MYKYFQIQGPIELDLDDAPQTVEERLAQRDQLIGNITASYRPKEYEHFVQIFDGCCPDIEWPRPIYSPSTASGFVIAPLTAMLEQDHTLFADNLYVEDVEFHDGTVGRSMYIVPEFTGLTRALQGLEQDGNVVSDRVKEEVRDV